MFKLRVDTGGTFTDCWGLSKTDECPRLAKVLSSGRLRVSVIEWLDSTRLRIEVPDSWQIKDSFFTGYKIASGDETSLVLSFDAKQQELCLSREICQTNVVDLFTREEAPVLGARLLTGTSLDESFPPLDFRLATTRGTNALLERKGAKVGLFITEGFGDLLTIRDQRRRDLFALSHELPEQLYEAVEEVTGRMDSNGKEIVALRLDEAFDQRASALLAKGITIASVALLHSYHNPAHEKALKARLSDLGFEHVSTSSELAPLIKILPRTETCVVNAYLQPVMQGFLNHIRGRVGDSGRLLTMTSAGGLEQVESYCPKDSLLSGPAGGVSGAAAIAEALGFKRILTFDMGGTSTDVARYDGAFQYRFEQEVGDARLLSPALKIETVAAGGGSICQWKNSSLLVGPESAGADPGPACYGQGGPLTVTDVNLLLGRIDPDNFGIPLTQENFIAAEKAAL
ncbi:MAG: hydantoinase/oxoprolinase family protein, partial [Verrucomicrobiota bacterium]